GAGCGAGALGPDAAARRLLHAADRERARPGRRSASRRDGGAGDRRQCRPRPGRYGWHRQDPAGGGHRPYAVEPGNGGPGALGDRVQPGCGPDRLCAGAGRRGAAGPLRGARGGRIALPGLAGRDAPAVAGGDRAPQRPRDAARGGAMGRPGGGVGAHPQRPARAAPRANGRRAVEVVPLSARESLVCLSNRLRADRDQWNGALDLAADLGFLPIALAQAGTLMAYTGIDCREYRTRMADWRQRLAAGNGALPPAVADTGALALEFADRLPPTGLARPMLALISMLDPNGIPGAVLTTP